MKNMLLFNITGLLTLILFFAQVDSLKAQIANGYPHDSLIHNDPSVIFTEMFEGSVSSLTTSDNWTLTSPNPLNILSDQSVPFGSNGLQSLRLITINDGTNQNQNTFVYKKISPDITDSIFVRYYIKYDTNTIYHHSGVYVGGKNPPSSLPGLIGGVLPLGNKEFHVGTEIRDTANFTHTTNSLFGFYNYWMGMHSNNSNIYWGNEFFNSTSEDNIDLDHWNCIEMMIKLNNPVTASNGELKLWINGVQISHLGYLFPNGSWSETHFTEGTGIPFEGFQWRNDDALNLNYIWLRNFNDNNSQLHNGNIYFDHLVVAKKYIGPISNTVSTGINEVNIHARVSIYPNPANHIIKFSTIIGQVSVFDMLGQIVFQKKNAETISTAKLQNGLYIIQTDNTFHKIMVRH